VSKEFYLDAYFPFATVEEIKASTGWDLKISPEVKVVPEPTEHELKILREVDETGSLRKKK
jgi:glutaconate CoA-transferase subunit B